MSSCWSSRHALLLISFVAACGGGPERPEPSTTAGADPCAVPLSVDPDRRGVATLTGTRFRVTGGSEALSFRFVHDRSGGLLQPSSGDYIAGDTPRVVDVIAVDDGRCGTSAEASVNVWAPMSLSPPSAVVPPGTTFPIRDLGGSGRIRCTRTINGTDGALDGCTWTAGPVSGFDEIRVEDEETGDAGSLTYVSDPDARLEVVGERILLPLGHPFELAFTGGTQLLDLQVSGPGLELDGRTLVGVDPGAYTVTATDQVVPEMTTTFGVEVVAPRIAPIPRSGGDTDWGDVLGADVDGDGYDDAVVSALEPSVGAQASGAVFVYAGGAAGLSPDPVATFTVEQAFAFAGRGIALGDLDGDGALDLAVGADGWDDGDAIDAGRVDVYRGIPGGFFEPTPIWTRVGANATDHLGSAVAMCDVNGDGIDDLAAGGFGMAEPGGNRPNEGGVLVFLGSLAGPSTVPAVELYSQTQGFQMARRLAGGDIDADGRCDLAAVSLTRALDGAGQDGIVWVFTGAAMAGAVRPVPFARTYTHDDAADDVAQLGRALALADLDEDGRDDLVAAAWRAGAGGVDRGAVYVFLETDHAGEGAVGSSAAHAVVSGEVDGDRVGHSVSVGGGGLWIGASGADRVVRFELSGLRGPVGASTAGQEWSGGRPGDRFGTAVGWLGDGGGGAEAVVYAASDNAYGVQAGAALSIGRTATTTLLGFPGAASGSGLGSPGAIAWLDHDGNGTFDLLAGTPGAPSNDAIDVGAVQWWSGFDGRWGIEPDRSLQGVPAALPEDHLGVAVASAGDFDGNGVEDIVVVAEQADRPAAFDPGRFYNPYECPGELIDVGAAWVFRGGARTPSFVVYGLAAGDRLQTVAGGFDHDGDGFDDLVLGSTLYGSEGGFTLVRGRPGRAGWITVICDPEHWVGITGGSRLGGAVAAVGDVDGDGCDEFAVGADGDDLGLADQGSVRVMFGYGPWCGGPDVPQVVTLVSGTAGDRLGTGVAGGQDADGDGVPDLVVGAAGAGGQGAAWLESGAWLATRPRDQAEVLPGGNTTRSLVDPGLRFDGAVANGGLGRAVALVPDPARPGQALVAVGQPGGAVGGTPGAGGVWLLRYPGGAGPEVAGLIGGTAFDPGDGFGEALAGDPRLPVLAVGAPRSDAGVLDGGAVYPFTVR